MNKEMQADTNEMCSPEKVERFCAAVKKFQSSDKTSSDYLELLVEFEVCCSTWKWSTVADQIDRALS